MSDRPAPPGPAAPPDTEPPITSACPCDCEINQGPIELLSEPELAALLHLKSDALRYWRRHGSGPAFVKVGGDISGKVLYRGEDVRAWLASRVRLPAPPGAPAPTAEADVQEADPC